MIPKTATSARPVSNNVVNCIIFPESLVVFNTGNIALKSWQRPKIHRIFPENFPKHYNKIKGI